MNVISFVHSLGEWFLPQVIHLSAQVKSLITSLASCAGPQADVIYARLVTVSQTKSMSSLSVIMSGYRAEVKARKGIAG